MIPGTIASMLERVRAIKLEAIAGDIIDQDLDVLRKMNLDQLMHGRNNMGEMLSPKHSENPWFKKPGAAGRYAAWKHRLNPLAPFDVPDLRITGVFHESISFTRRGEIVAAEASASFAPNINETFRGTALGLEEENIKKTWQEVIRSPMIHILSEKIGCDVGVE